MSADNTDILQTNEIARMGVEDAIMTAAEHRQTTHNENPASLTGPACPERTSSEIVRPPFQ